MDVIETQMQRTSPILRVTTDISEFKPGESKEDIRAPETSRSRNSGEANLRHASNLLQKKKQLRPLFSSPNPYRSSSYYASNAYSIHPNSKSNVSSFTQRIMSAKLLRVKQLQNEIKDTQIQLHEAKNENRILKTLQKRQDNALKKYEGDQAQLPQLIKSHNEELRIVTTQYKQLKANYRELESKLRQRVTELDELKEQHGHLVKLSRDKHLGQRERLSKQVEDLKETVKEQNERIQVLTRRVELEGKNYKHQLNVEMMKHKETQLELAMAHKSIENLKNLIEAKDKYINNAVPNRFFEPSGKSGIAQVFSTSITRFRNIPKTAGHVSLHSKRDSEETINSANFNQSGRDTDETSELSSSNPTLKNVQNRVKLNSCNLNLRKKLSNRKLLIKSNQAKLNLNSNEEQKDDKHNDTDTPHYSSSLQSINNSVENSKYNSSESDTLTKMSSIKTKRRVSIDSGHTVISDNTSPNNEGNDFDYDDLVDSKDDYVHHNGDLSCDIDCNDTRNSSNSSDCKTHFKEEKSKKKILHSNNNNNKQIDKKVKSRRNSVPSIELDAPLENITDSLMKAQNKDRLLRQKSIKDELKELEKRLKQNNHKFMIDRNSSFESLFDQKAQSVKDELKEFEEQLMNSCELKSYSSSVSKTFEEEADKVVKNVTNTLDILHDENDVNDNESDCNDTEGDDNIRKKFGLKDISLSWNAMRDKFQREREQTEAILDEYYNNMGTIKNDDNKFEDNDDNFEVVSEEDEDEEDENGKADVKLNEVEKTKLLKALNRIDLEETGGKSSVYSSSDGEIKDQRNSFNLNYKIDLNTSDNLNNMKSSYNYEFPKIKNVDGEFTQEFDKVKSKTDLMDQLFGNSHPFKSQQQETTKNIGNT